MIITYIRSSSYNNWDFCQMQYFLTYVLGWQPASGHKAEKGTVAHKVLELLANIKQTIDETQENCFDDEHIGLVEFSRDELMKPHHLSDDAIAVINKSRINKTTYKIPCKLKGGHIRYGVELVEELIQRVYDYYVDKSAHTWQPVDFKDCTNYVWIALDYANGQFDPRKRKIVAAEPHFDIEIKRPWAYYEYVLPSGEEISGYLRIKGTIDLVTLVDGGILEIVDWKTGQRLDWTSGEVKDYEKLCKDPQLMLYYYAVKQLFPEYENTILSIFFIRDGGPFSVCFDDETITKMETLLEKRFTEIKKTEFPQMLDVTQKNFRCNKICDYYKRKLKPGDKDNMCKTIHTELQNEGLEHVTHTMSNPDFNVSFYSAPGE